MAIQAGSICGVIERIRPGVTCRVLLRGMLKSQTMTVPLTPKFGERHPAGENGSGRG
jgi:hypothetical protein